MKQENIQKVLKWGRRFAIAAASFMLVLSAKTDAKAAGVLDVDMQPAQNGAFVYNGNFADYETTIYHKIVVTKPGALVIKGYNYNTYGYKYSIGIALCDKNKNVLEPYGTSYVNTDDYEVYGVKAGTYYICTKNQKSYILAAATQNYADKGGSSKKKASKIKHNKAITGVLAAGEKGTRCDWFKFNVPKSKKLELQLEASGNDSVCFYLYGPSYPRGIYIDLLKNKSGKYYSVSGIAQKKSKVKKGTYYIKAYRYSKKKTASAVYKIKWKMK